MYWQMRLLKPRVVTPSSAKVPQLIPTPLVTGSVLPPSSSVHAQTSPRGLKRSRSPEEGGDPFGAGGEDGTYCHHMHATEHEGFVGLQEGVVHISELHQLMGATT